MQQLICCFPGQAHRGRMDLYDPQVLGVVVFGGFVLFSVLGIVLVSTFSMKETSYEEALAKQRRELEKASLLKVEKKKKEKTPEKRGKAKKREEKPNGRILERNLHPDPPESRTAAGPEPALLVEPVVFRSPAVPPSASQENERPTPLPKGREKKEKKAKVEPAASQPVSVPPIAGPLFGCQRSCAAQDPVPGAAAQELPTAPPAPAGVQRDAPPVLSGMVKKPESPGSQDGAPKKKAMAKRKRESTAMDDEGAPCLPFKTLISIVSGMAFGEGEAQQLIETLTEKTGDVQDPWLRATEKGNPVAVLKRQLEDREKQLAVEQENTAAVKAKLKELTRELAAEKAKSVALENKWKAQLLLHEQEMSTRQAEMQQLQGKIRTLQEQLENGPNTQLARLQQENSILRDALNQATSQAESKQNAELAKLRQECSKLSKELTEKSEALQQAEEQKSTLQGKAATFEKQISQLQVSQKENEAPLQKKLDDTREELGRSRARCQSLQAELEMARKQQQTSFAELQSKLLCSEMELKGKLEELNSLQIQLPAATSKSVQLAEKVELTEALLEASQRREAEKTRAVQEANQTEDTLMQLRFEGSLEQLSALENEAAELRDVVEHLKIKNRDMSLYVEAASEARSSLQAECDQYRATLAETERMLKALQRSVEEEEQVWAAKVSALEDALQKSKDQMKCLEDDVEKLKVELQNTGKLRQLLSESQEHLDATKQEALKKTHELVQVQDSVRSLQVELEKLRLEGGTAASAKEEVLQLQGTLDKEKKLTKDLGCAATKLKELLTVTQEQLAKERETVMKLQKQLEEKGENAESTKEGTSV
ncbi:ribosome-binding protein 1 isoform X2 [Varanus komodoensis]|nr:ribosome-binding protein 1 isoform X2 [Varanus komodoensis]